MPPKKPTVIVLGGVNGAGKSTSARALLAEQLSIMTFVNADEIARGLNAFAPETVAFAAGRVMLQRLTELVQERASFAFETTLAGRTYVPFLRGLRNSGYVIEVHYFWLNSVDLAIERVRNRVRSGGHDIPEVTIRQRNQKSVRNFWTYYRGMADVWYLYDNSGSVPDLMAAGEGLKPPELGECAAWPLFRRMVNEN